MTEVHGRGSLPAHGRSEAGAPVGPTCSLRADVVAAGRRIHPRAERPPDGVISGRRNMLDHT